MNKDICDLTCSWLSLAIPPLSVIKDTVEKVSSLSDTILFDKLFYIMTQQDSDFDIWLKLSENFEKDNSKYNKMVKQVIYNINAINEVEMLDSYANLLRSYKLEFINKNDFLRMGFTLTNLLAEDAEYLKSNISKEKIEENIFCLSLAQNNLMYNSTRGFVDDELDYYKFTDLGRMLDKYAVDFRNEEKYNYSEKDLDLSTQRLSYIEGDRTARFG